MAMKRTYETLDEYLDDLDKIKESIANETKGMNAPQVGAYFAKARQEFEKVTGKKLRTRRTRRKIRATGQ
jgi:hypothetical protein